MHTTIGAEAVIVDWPLVLDFTKALASPIAAVTAVYLGGRLTIRGFRAQKLIERRLNWYEQASESIAEMLLTADRAIYSGEETEVENARHAAFQAMECCVKAPIYAEKVGLDAMMIWLSRVRPLVASALSKNTVEQLRSACADVRFSIANEIRADLRLSPVSEFDLRWRELNEHRSSADDLDQH